MIQRTALREQPAADREAEADPAAPSRAAVAAPNSALAQLLSGIGAPWATALLQNLSVSNNALAETLSMSELMDMATEMDAEATAPGPGAGAAAPTPAAAVEPPPAPAPPAPPGEVTDATPAPTVIDEPSQAPIPMVAATDGGVHAPANDPAFQAVVARATDTASQQRAHMPARGAATSAQNAAPGPSNQVRAQAAARSAEQMEQTPSPGFDRAAFKARLLEQISAAAPKTSKEAKDFPKENKMGKAKQAMLTDAAQAGDAAQGGIRQQAQAPPDVAGITPKPTAPLDVPQPAAPPPGIQAVDAAPKPRPDAEVVTPFAAANDSLDTQMAEAGITDEQLAMSNEPTFMGAVQARSDAKAHGEQAPQAFLQGEAAVVSSAQVDAEGTAQGALAGMYDARVGLFGQVASAQGETMTADQERRAQVAAQIESIYQSTSQRVTLRLQQMDEEITRVFDGGAEAARVDFERYVDDKLDDRYSGLRGKWRWTKDKLLSWGLAEPVARIFADAREHYLAQMETVIDQVVGVVERGITDARAIVADGRQQIATYVESLPAQLQDVGQQAAADIQGRFDELEGSIDAKQNELVDSLTRRYVEQVAAIDARIEELEAEHSSFVSRAYNAVKGVVEAILRLKDLLLGVLARAAEAIGGIISDPIGFLGNLVDGVKAGLDNFLGRIWDHLSRAMQEWLFGALSGAGIDLPENFDEAGILDLVLQVLGLTYQGIRARAVRIVGEDVVSKLEQFAEPFIVLIREGPGGLWEWISEQLTNLKDMVLGEIQDWAITKVIKAGIMWIISLLNPAAAFIKACKAIYDIVMFFIERGSQIMDMVNAVVESISAIAKGAIGGVATKIENALARTLPVVISFLASLLGLGGISDKIRAVIEKLQAPVGKAVDWVIEKSVSLIRAAGNLLGFGEEDEGGADATAAAAAASADQASQADVDATDHPAVAARVALDLEQVDTAGSYEAIRARLQERATAHERMWSPRLEPGVGLRVEFQPANTDRGDLDIDFNVVIAPNTEVNAGSVTPEPDIDMKENDKAVVSISGGEPDRHATFRGLQELHGQTMAKFELSYFRPGSIVYIPVGHTHLYMKNENARRDPHTMQLMITVDGAVVVAAETFTSGDMTQEEYELGFPLNMLETHTEAKALKKYAQHLVPGARWELTGEYLACHSCKGRMNVAARSGAIITYSPGAFTAS